MDAETGIKKELLYCWVSSRFRVLVPKRRGTGFLKVPYGHHPDKVLDRIAIAAGCDVIGLDGALEFECSGAVYHGSNAVRAEFAGIVVPRLEAHYGLTAREIPEHEYWRLTPIPHTDGF